MADFLALISGDLRADKTGIQGACDGNVGSALNDGAAVGEKGESVGPAAKAEQEVVGAKVHNIGVGRETGAHSGEVDRAVVLVDLHGIAAAEGDVRSILAGEV